MQEMAERIVDLLREKGVSIQKARMTLELAIHLLMQEPLGKKAGEKE